MIPVLVKEINGFFNSLIAYVTIGVFLTSIGLLMWVFPETAVFDSGYAGMDALFSLGPYVFIFLIPAITMRSFAEERKMGTMELLQTKPISDWEILIGKFLAAVVLVVLALLPTLLYYYTVRQIGSPPGNVDSSGVAGSYIGLLMLGSAFCAIGTLSSALTNNQIVAFIFGAFLCFLFYVGIDSAAELATAYGLQIKQLGIGYHYESLSKGLIDSRDLVYFLSLCALFLLLTKTVLSSRSW